MTEKIDPFIKGLKINFNDDGMVIKKKAKRNSVAIIVGIPVLLLLFFLISFELSIQRVGEAAIYLLFSLFVVYFMWQLNFTGLYPTTELNFKNFTFKKIPSLRGWKEKQTSFTKVDGIGFFSKAVGGHTSAYEEGNTDYRNTIVLETDVGDLRLCTYMSRSEEIEDSVIKFTDVLKEKLGLTKKDAEEPK